MTPKTRSNDFIPVIPAAGGPGEEQPRGLGILSVIKALAPVTLPLARVRIAARVADRIAEVAVTETFRNPHPDHLEAVYIFPLPGGAAVSDFEMTVGTRTLRGRVEERGEAQRQYRKALNEGKRTALLEQERDDVFTVQVGNLPPGEEVTVRISYSERLPFFEDGTTELRLPLVVAPRYIPGTPQGEHAVGEGVEEDTEVVPDASRITPPRLAPGFDPQVMLEIEVEFLRSDGAGPESAVRELCCSQHATRTTTENGNIKVAPARGDERLDRDFVLRWRLAEAAVQTTLNVYRDAQGNTYGMLSIIPPERDGFLGLARDVLFVLDRSGSMTGVKMVSAARACSLLLATLGPRDRFAIQAFDNVSEWFKPERAAGPGEYFLRADESGIARGEQFLRAITARGGTELDAALGEALAAIPSRREPNGRVPVIVLLTDGQIGDESRVLRRIQTEIGDTRVFTVGIDTAVNEGFLRRLAALGGGTATFVEPGMSLEEALRSVGREIGTPLVFDIALENGDGEIDAPSIAPSRIPDLFAGRATTVLFRLKRLGRLRVRGRRADGGLFEETVAGREVALPTIAQLWARAHVADLEDRFRIEPDAQAELKKQIVELAVRHALLTRFTAYVVVDESEVVNADGSRRKIVQPVEMPARWEMEIAGANAVAAMTLSSPTLAKAPSPMRYSTSARRKEEVHMDAMAPEAFAGTSVPAPPAAPEGGRGWIDSLTGAVSRVLRGGDPPEIAAEAMSVPTRREAVKKALLVLAEAIASARAEVEAGRVPAPDRLVEARAELQKSLAGSDLATRLPELQRFLRTGLLELITVLRMPGVQIASLRTLFERLAKEFEKVKREAASYFGPASSDPAERAFWESNI